MAKEYKIIAIIALLISLWGLYNSYYPPLLRPNIYLSTNYDGNKVYFPSDYQKTDFLLFVYNGGNGPCVDATLKFPEVSEMIYYYLRPQKVFRQYTDLKDEIKSNASGGFLCSGDCFLGVLDPNEVLVVDFVRNTQYVNIPSSFKISLECATGEKKDITILKKEN